MSINVSYWNQNGSLSLSNVAVRSFNAETAKPLTQAYEMLEDITSIIACQEKKLCLSYAICSYSTEWDDSDAFINAASNLVILIKACRISSKQWFYPIKIILQDLAWRLE